MSDEYKFDNRKLLNLLKAFKGEIPEVRVGILGMADGQSERNEGALTNATIGAIHEFGGPKMPRRSFLRLPIHFHLNQALEKSGAFDKNSVTFKEVIKTKNVMPYMLAIAATAEAVVLEAFDTGGYGQWVPSNMDRKKVKQTLVESQQLRNSITSQVK